MAALLLDVVYAVALLLFSPVVLYRVVAQGRYRCGWKARLGLVRRRVSPRPCIWIHAVSVGEVNATRTLVARLRQVLPEYEFVFSSTTDTGMVRLRQLYEPRHRCFFFPFDFSWAVRQALARVRPSLCVLMEGEVWPNFTLAARRQGVPMVVANARIGGRKGWPRYRRVAWLIRGMFGRLSLVLAQDEVHAQRYEYLGTPADAVVVVGSLKYDTADIADKVEGADVLADSLGLDGDSPLWVAGQTGPGEEGIVLDVYEALRREAGLESLRLAIVPRKPERFEQVGRLIETRGFRLVRYSEVKAGQNAEKRDTFAIILGDTMGDLRKFYSLATAVFVGRSLAPMGGSDVMEVAALGKVVVVGPHTENFAPTVKLLAGGGVLEVVRDAESLRQATLQLLTDPTRTQQRGALAQQLIRDNQGATERSAAAIVDRLGLRMPTAGEEIASRVISTAKRP